MPLFNPVPTATTSTAGIVTLDGTAADIVAPMAAVAVAGATGKAADAGHAHADTVISGHGLLAWNFSHLMASSASGVLTSGVVYVMRIPLTGASISVTNIVAAVFTAGSSLTSSECFAGLYDNTGTKVGGTADQSGSWTSTGLKTMALVSGPFNTSATFAYVVIVSNGTTNPVFARASGAGVGSSLVSLSWAAASMPFATNGTGATALPSSLTYSSNSSGSNPQSIWVALS
jgi:hypothetical protein